VNLFPVVAAVDSALRTTHRHHKESISFQVPLRETLSFRNQGKMYEISGKLFSLIEVNFAKNAVKIELSKAAFFVSSEG
jgi:hypothetical protein